MAIDFKKFLKSIGIKNDVDQSKALIVTVDSGATANTTTTLKAQQTANVTVTLPNASTTLVGSTDTATLTNKTIDADLNTITNIDNNDIKAGAAIDAAKIANGTVSSAEFQFLSNVTSDIQTQFTSASSDLTAHLNDTIDAHDASAISNVPSGNLAATDLQGAVNELQSDINTRLLKAGDTMSGALNMGSNLITSLATPVSGTDAANKNYVDGISAGLDPKESVRVATTASVGGTYATTPSNGQFTGAATIIDGVALSVGDRVLIKDQADLKQNGIYTYSAASQFTRSADMDGSPASEVSGGNFVFVAQGTTQSASGYVLVANGILTLNTDNLTFTQFSGGANSANKTLSNLDSPTSVNQTLTPAANSTQDLGTTAKRWQDLYVSALKDAAGVSAVNVQNRQLTDSAGNPSLTYSSATEMSANSKRIVSLADPLGLTHAMNKQSVAASIKNLIADGDAEGADIFSLYNDGASSRPVDGTAGTVTTQITTTVTSTGAIDGSKSFLLSKTAVNAQGYGWSVPFTISQANQAKVMQIEFDYKISSTPFTAGTSTTDSDLIVYVYDVTNNQLIQPSTFKLFSNSATIGDKFVTNFQTSATGTSYRLIFHIATTVATAWSLFTDNISIKPSTYVYGTPITDWQLWTPTSTWTTGATHTGLKRRVGSDGEYKVKLAIIAGVTAANLIINLPSGEVIDTNRVIDVGPNTDWSFGQVTMLDSGTATFVGGVSYNNTTSFQIRALSATATYVQDVGPVTNIVPATWASPDVISMQFRVPIVGWAASTQMSDSYDGRLVAATYRTSADVTITTSNADVVWNTKIDDNCAIMNTTTGIVTVPSAGKYSFNLTGRHDTGAGVPGEIQYALIVTGKNAGTYVLWDISNLAASKIFPISGSIDLEMNAGDTAKINAVSTTNASTLKGGASLYTAFSIKKLQAPTTISATESINARYYASSTSISGTLATIVWATKDYDSHGGMTSGVYTIPTAGRYQINSSILTSGTIALNNVLIMEIQKNGSVVSRFTEYQAATLTNADGQLHDIIQCNAGDTIRVQVSFNATAPAIVSSNFDNFFSICRLGL